MGCGISKSFVQGAECEIFLAITYLCSSYITEEEINDLEKLFMYIIDCGALYFQKSERDLPYVGLIEKKILKKGMEKSIPDLKAEFMCMCVREKKITVLKFM